MLQASSSGPSSNPNPDGFLLMQPARPIAAHPRPRPRPPPAGPPSTDVHHDAPPPVHHDVQAHARNLAKQSPPPKVSPSGYHQWIGAASKKSGGGWRPAHSFIDVLISDDEEDAFGVDLEDPIDLDQAFADVQSRAQDLANYVPWRQKLIGVRAHLTKPGAAPRRAHGSPAQDAPRRAQGSPVQ